MNTEEIKSKIDIKFIFILVLAAALILSFIFRPSEGIDTYEDEINLLKQQNEALLNNNDSIMGANEALNLEIQNILTTIDSTEAQLANTEDKLNDLEHEKGKVSGYVESLNADGVAESLEQYLERKKN